MYIHVFIYICIGTYVDMNMYTYPDIYVCTYLLGLCSGVLGGFN